MTRSRTGWAWVTLILAVASVTGCGMEVAQDTRRCRPDETVTGSPRSIAEAVDLINALPRPVTAECFVESLDRPLLTEATSSLLSAQPADGQRSPRLFFFYDPLILAVAVDGPGRELLEFGELVEEARTLKGEIEFPVTEPLQLEAAFERVLFGDGSLTSCALCHRMEGPSDTVDGGFVSAAFRPSEFTILPIEGVAAEHATCDANAEPERCAYLEAVFAHGPVVHQPFPDSFPTFLN